MPVTTQHTPRTSWNVLLLVVLLLPTTRITTTTTATTTNYAVYSTMARYAQQGVKHSTCVIGENWLSENLLINAYDCI